MRLFFFILLFPPLSGFSQLKPASIFSSNMVLPRDEPFPVWGKAMPGSKVEIRVGAKTITTVTGKDSAWKVTLPPQPANHQPQSLFISSQDTAVQLQNILFGDVWVCIGQSNMEWPMMREMHYKEELPNSHQPLLRFYNPTYAGKNIFGTPFTDSVAAMLTVANFYKGHWQFCDSSSVKTMSAVAYYFGKQVSNEINIPVGLINLSIGGAPIETFINLDVLQADKQFSAKANGDWLVNKALPDWVKERGKQNVGSLAGVPADKYGKNHAFKPGFAYEAGIKPLLWLPVKGIICYQGESNAQEMERVNEYAALQAIMVEDYRAGWKQPQLPFYYVQLSSIDTIKYKSRLWPQFRDEQRKMMQLIPNSGMAVSSDIGDKHDVHPLNKKEVGERLARWALNKTYHKPILPTGPMPAQATYKNGKISITFYYTGQQLLTADDKVVRGFSVDGMNECSARIENKKIVIPVKAKPFFVYYGWEPFTDANLVNAGKLPATTFKIKVK